ncbi:MAG: hypothetical protein RBT81_06660 [Gammaproteobacteria bacterium]|nr:hypothetical protein [Gammaproteobacteria bacterium]
MRTVCNASSRTGRRLAAVLAAALLLAVWAEAGHMADVAAHEGGSVCEVCLFASASGHGVAPTLASVPAFGLPVSLAVEDAALAPSFLLRRVQSPRAPPYFS